MVRVARHRRIGWVVGATVVQWALMRIGSSLVGVRAGGRVTLLHGALLGQSLTEKVLRAGGVIRLRGHLIVPRVDRFGEVVVLLEGEIVALHVLFLAELEALWVVVLIVTD